MDLSELRSRVYRELSEDANAFFSDEEIDDWINEGAREIAIQTLWNKKDTTETITDTTDTYSLPDDFIKEYQVYIDDNKIDDIPMEEKGKKTGYYIWQQDEIILSKIGEGEMKIYYFALPTTISADLDEPNLPLEHQKLLITYTLLQAKKKDIEFVPQIELQLLNQDYQKGLTLLQNRYNRKPSREQFKVERI